MAASPVRIVLVGCGSMSQRWLEVARDHAGIELVALVDLSKEAAEKRAESAGLTGISVGTDLSAVLSANAVDAVFDVTVPAAHHTVTMTALSHGCHVLGEKPLASSMREAQEMVAAAEQAGKIYAVIQNRRYTAHIRTVRKLLADKVIGHINEIHGDFFLGPHFGGFREEMDHVLLLDMSIHHFDAARFLIGKNAKAVYAHEWNPRSSWCRHGASAMAVFEMEDGIVYTYRGSWCAAGAATDWGCGWRIIGEKGSLCWDGSARIDVETTVPGNEDFIRKTTVETHDVQSFPEHDDGHASIIHEFVSCIQSGQPPETAGSDNINSLAMVFGAIESCERKIRVVL